MKAMLLCLFLSLVAMDAWAQGVSDTASASEQPAVFVAPVCPPGYRNLTERECVRDDVNEHEANDQMAEEAFDALAVTLYRIATSGFSWFLSMGLLCISVVVMNPLASRTQFLIPFGGALYMVITPYMMLTAFEDLETVLREHAEPSIAPVVLVLLAMPFILHRYKRRRARALVEAENQTAPGPDTTRPLNRDEQAVFDALARDQQERPTTSSELSEEHNANRTSHAPGTTPTSESQPASQKPRRVFLA